MDSLLKGQYSRWTACDSDSAEGWTAGLGIRSFAQVAQIKWATVSDLLRSLRTNEQLWANRSGCSCQKSHRERIAQVAHDKWATVSASLRLLMINERMSKLLKKIWLKLYFWYVFCTFKKKKSDSLFFNERCERIAQFAHQKWAMWGNRLGRSPEMSDHERIALVAHQKWANERIARFFLANRSFTHFFAKNELFAQKTNEQIPSPGGQLVKGTVQQVGSF